MPKQPKDAESLKNAARLAAIKAYAAGAAEAAGFEISGAVLSRPPRPTAGGVVHSGRHPGLGLRFEWTFESPKGFVGAGRYDISAGARWGSPGYREDGRSIWHSHAAVRIAHFGAFLKHLDAAGGDLARELVPDRDGPVACGGLNWWQHRELYEGGAWCGKEPPYDVWRPAGSAESPARSPRPLDVLDRALALLAEIRAGVTSGDWDVTGVRAALGGVAALEADRKQITPRR